MNSIVFFLGDKPISFHPLLKKITGSTNAALFLSQILYWWPRKTEDWVWKTIEELEIETGLTRKEQDGAKKILIKLGLIETKIKGLPARRFFKVNEARLVDLVLEKNAYVAPSEERML